MFKNYSKMLAFILEKAEGSADMATKKILPKKKARTQMSFEADWELRDAFILCCRENDTNSSRELRAFMKRYIARNGQQRLV